MDVRERSGWYHRKLLQLADSFEEAAATFRTIAADINANLDNPKATTDVTAEYLAILEDLKGIVRELESLATGGDAP